MWSDSGLSGLWPSPYLHSALKESMQHLLHDDAGVVVHPSIEANGMMMIRLQRLHLSSNPLPRTLAISCPHSQRVSWGSLRERVEVSWIIRSIDVEIENNY